MQELPRVLGLRQTTAIVVGAVIGVGIFFTPSQVARFAGSETLALVCWTLGGVLALTGGMVFAELGRRFPHAGGQYKVVHAAWGPFAGFVYVACLLTAIQAGAAAIIARIAARNLVVTLGTGNADVLAVAMVVAVIGVNLLGVRQGAGVQVATVLAKLAVLAGIAVAAVAWAPEVPAPAAAPPTGMGWLAGLIPAMFSYGGWQHALWMAGEVKDPARTLPRAIGLGMSVVVAAYLSAVWAYFALLGYDGVVASKTLAADAVAAVFPGLGGRFVAGAVAVSAFGVLNAQFLAGPRQTWAIARDGLFPAALGWLHPTRATPMAAIAALGVCTGVVLTLGDDIGKVIAWTVVIDSVFFGLTALALLRFQKGAWDRYSVAAITFAGLEVVGIAGALTQPDVRAAAVTGLVWVGVVALAYAVVRRWR